MPSKKRYFHAFSLIEVSVVILIIGIFIAGVVVVDGMISKFRIAAAKNLSLSSPISTIPDSALWLETALDSSFNSSEAKNDSSLSTWYDQRNTSNKVAITTAGSSPTYSNTINRVHAVEFDGTANKHFTFDGSFLNNTDYTIFILEKRKDPKGDNYFLGEAGSGLNNSLALGYSADNQIIHAQGTNSYPSGISTYSDSKDKPRVFAFSHSASSGNQTYINGVLAAENTDVAAKAHLTGIGTLAIGKGYVGEIGEIAVFTRALSDTDRTSIEDYLGKKWTSSINRNKAPNCIGGLVTINGCDNSAPITCSATGTGYNQTGLAYTSGSSFNCDSGFNGTINYSCLASGPATITSGSCTANAPSATCSATATMEYSAQTNLSYSTGNLTFPCDLNGYVGNKNYTCLTSGPATGITGTCTRPTCTTPAGTGYLAQTNLPYAVSGAGSFSCDTASGYVGTINYTCTTAGPATGIAGTCTQPICTTPAGTGYDAQTNLSYSTGSGSFNCKAGFTGSKTYTCTTSGPATGIAGTCTAITCTAPAATGYLAQTNLPYAASGTGTFSCNDTGYTGNKTYTCTTAGPATDIAGTCTAACTVTGATNGTHTPSQVSGSTIHTFRTTSAPGGASASFTFNCPSARTAKILIVAGGGGGGGANDGRIGGAGGAGGLIYQSSYSIPASTPITIGVGSGGLSNNNGKDSSFGSSLIAVGGGRGAAYSNGAIGGSGAGGAAHSSACLGGNGTTGQGNKGGNPYFVSTNNSLSFSGGGGGAGQAGANGTSSGGGKGGDGSEYDISGTPTYYAGGGGGSNHPANTNFSTTKGSGGLGGGGAGGVAGLANTGGGGGTSGAGGSGIVIISY